MLTVVIGPPCAGKSTWCREHAKPDDIIIDFDLLANALSADRPDVSKHEHADAVKAVTKTARQAAIDKALTITTVDVYLIHSTPSDKLLDKYRRAGAVIQVVDPGHDIVWERVKRLRPWWMQPVVKRWYEERGDLPAKPKTTTEKGLGWAHQQNRDGLFRVHMDGTPCWWCGQPMHRDRTRNPDYDPASTDPASGSLAADHQQARANGGTKANRLLHGRCNKSRGKGDRDHLRPALQGAAAPSGTNSLDW